MGPRSLGACVHLSLWLIWVSSGIGPRWLGECPAHLVHWATAAVTGKQVYCSSSRWLGECPAHLVHWATAAVTGKQVYCSSSRWLGEYPAHLVHWATAAVTGKQVYCSSSRCFLKRPFTMQPQCHDHGKSFDQTKIVVTLIVVIVVSVNGGRL